jgi:hypothetical protein
METVNPCAVSMDADIDGVDDGDVAAGQQDGEKDSGSHGRHSLPCGGAALLA